MMEDPRSRWILEHVTNKDVLDLGCVRHSLAETRKAGWLHEELRARARRVLGVDYLPEEVADLGARGYEVVCANVEEMQLGERFDVVVAGDIIEHLDNPGRFLDRVREHLRPGGLFVVTTPNPLNPLRFISLLFGGAAHANAEHTCWFTEQVLCQLMARHSFEPVEVRYADDSYQYYRTLKWAPFLPLNRALVRMRPRFSETICAAFTVTA